MVLNSVCPPRDKGKRFMEAFWQHIKKQRHYLANKGLSSQSYGFLSSHIWILELDHKEGWAPRIDAFELWCWRRLLRVPWTARRSHQPILKEISPECSLEGLRLKLKLQSFGHLMGRADSLEKTPMLGNIEGGRRRGQKRMRWLDGITIPMDMNLGKLQQMMRDREALVCCSPWGHKESNMTWWMNKRIHSQHPTMLYNTYVRKRKISN